jgi:hypothetical protein
VTHEWEEEYRGGNHTIWKCRACGAEAMEIHESYPGGIYKDRRTEVAPCKGSR